MANPLLIYKPSIAQLEERETVMAYVIVISMSLVRSRLEGYVLPPDVTGSIPTRSMYYCNLLSTYHQLHSALIISYIT